MKKSQKIELAIDVILGILCVVCALLFVFKAPHPAFIVAELVIVVLVLVYSCVGFKVPHGNLLKWLMILYALSLLITLNEYIYNGGVNVLPITIPLAMVMITYVAGRLHKVEQNRLIMTLVFGLEIANTVFIIKGTSITGGFCQVITLFIPLILWIIICGGYFTRFKEHKEAGMLDK